MFRRATVVAAVTMNGNDLRKKKKKRRKVSAGAASKTMCICLIIVDVPSTAPNTPPSTVFAMWKSVLYFSCLFWFSFFHCFVCCFFALLFFSYLNLCVVFDAVDFIRSSGAFSFSFCSLSHFLVSGTSNWLQPHCDWMWLDAFSNR